MSKSLLVAHLDAGASWTTGNFVGTAGASASINATEAVRAFRMRKAGTISGLAVNINGTGTSRTYKSRINPASGGWAAPADGNLAVSPGNGLSGWFYDDVNSDSINAGDEVAISLTSTGTPTGYTARMVFEASAGHVAYYCAVGSAALGAVSRASALAGVLGSFGSLSAALNVCRIAGTFSDFQVVVTTNGTSGTITPRFGKNGAAANMACTISAGATGHFEDNSNTDTVASGDSVNYRISGATGGITFVLLGVAFTASGGVANDVIASPGNGASWTAGTTYYIPISGGVSTGVTTESQAQIQHGFSGTLSKIRANIQTNSATSDVTFKSRINGADGTQSFIVTAGSFGQFEDLSGNSDAFGPTDNVCLQMSGGTSGSVTIATLAATEEWSAGASSSARSVVMGQALNRAAGW